jgi:membrane protein implicated in regulation of membrane protease activity
MLRACLIVVTAILLCVGIAFLAHGAGTPGWQLVGVSLVVLLGTLFERWRYRRISERRDGQWQRTSERFLDPATGQPVDVLFNPHTGERRYVGAEPERTEPPT